ncbi:MAG: DUF2059 domain-containing protein [Alphaproteobacteria bacterium]|nr:DUF2059 domain-containing protein [Alphaproteobacteria bacterium]
MRVLRGFFLVAICLVFAAPSFAQDESGEVLARKVDLARQIQALRPAKDQIDSAIERYTAHLPANQREVYQTSLKNVFNYDALEKASIDAYAQVYTEAELQAMLAYYSTPEAQSAVSKTDAYAALVYPEIIRMLDRAMMQVKTGGTSAQ